MKKSSNRLMAAGMLAFAGVVTAVVVSTASAAGPFGGPCFKGNCLDVYKPVLCPNGQVYSNDCYAAKACQKNCVPYGGDAS
ncbi:MAG: hypothetical protein J0L61_11900 [Planctomycetes bacterium]|nr:hypothetical protein [Planctomycetota bacterium]